MDIGRRTLVSMLVTQDAVEMLVDGRDDIEPCVWARFALGATSATLRAVPRESTEHHLHEPSPGGVGTGSAEWGVGCLIIRRRP
jgi:hypothetical protein